MTEFTRTAGECFVRPEEFVPERWYSQPELILDKGGFAPFSLGESQLSPLPLPNLQESTPPRYLCHIDKCTNGGRIKVFSFFFSVSILS